MKRVNRTLACLALLALGFCTACVDVVVSLAPWFEVEEGDSTAVVFDERLVGTWCEDDADCEADQVMDWRAGPGNSYNVFGGGRLRYRVWLGQLGEGRYLDWWFLCQPSTGTEDDGCLELDVPLGSHVVARIERLDEDELEFRILDGEKLEPMLEAGGHALQRARVSETLLVLEDTAGLRQFLELHGDATELWTEETMRMSRRSDQEPGGSER